MFSYFPSFFHSTSYSKLAFFCFFNYILYNAIRYKKGEHLHHGFKMFVVFSKPKTMSYNIFFGTLSRSYWSFIPNRTIFTSTGRQSISNIIVIILTLKFRFDNIRFGINFFNIILLAWSLLKSSSWSRFPSWYIYNSSSVNVLGFFLLFYLLFSKIFKIITK